MLPSGPEDGIHPYVFPLVVKLAKGEKLALVPIFLGSLFYRLDECVHNLSKSMGRYTVVSHVNSAFLHLFLWERFSNLAPQPVQFEAVTMRTIEEEDGIVKMVPNKPARMRAQRWSNLKQQRGKDLVDFIDSEKHFSLHPYGLTSRGIVEAKLYEPLEGKLVDVSAQRVSAELVRWMAIITPTLLPFVTKSKAGAVSYNPQRVMRQLGYDQSAIQVSGETGCSNSSLVESQFVGDGKGLIIQNLRLSFGQVARGSELGPQEALYIGGPCYTSSATL